MASTAVWDQLSSLQTPLPWDSNTDRPTLDNDAAWQTHWTDLFAFQSEDLSGDSPEEVAPVYQAPEEDQGVKAVSDRKSRPKWYREQSKKDKSIVSRKMGQLWYGKTDAKTRDLTQYFIAKNFTPEDFDHVLNSSCEPSDVILREIVKRTCGGKARALVRAKLKACNEENFDDDAALPRNARVPSWYSDMDYDAKKYVLNRMCFLWYGKFDDMPLRRKARSKVHAHFTVEDFNIAADPDTPYEKMKEIADRTRGREYHVQYKELSALKKKWVDSGLMCKRTADRYVREAIEKEGLDQSTVEELENHVVSKWSGYPTYSDWIAARDGNDDRS